MLKNLKKLTDKLKISNKLTYLDLKNKNIQRIKIFINFFFYLKNFYSAFKQKLNC